MDINRKSNLFQEVDMRMIQKIFAEKLHENSLISVNLVSGGLFNTTYKVQGCHGTYIIRFGPVNRHLLIGFEQNLMAAENYVYTLCRANQMACPNVLVCDSSRSLLDRDYMITEYIHGTVMAEAQFSDRDRIYEAMGAYARSMHTITNDRFGFVSRILTDHQTYTWAECLQREVNEMLDSLKQGGYFTQDEYLLVQRIYIENQPLLDEIKTAHLLHTDLWEGNVIISIPEEESENRTEHDVQAYPEIRAVIDSDRAVFGDVDFEWAAPWMNIPAIYRGAGIDTGSKEFHGVKRIRRRQIYRIFYEMINCYVGAFEYNDQEMYRSCKQNALQESLELS